MSKIIEIGERFWNIRGSFRVLGIELGTHCSLVELSSSKGTDPSFVFLDSYTIPPDSPVAEKIDQLTDNGKHVDSIINVHPFHTIHVKAMHEAYPNAKLYGTKRHHDMFPDLPWQKELTESKEFKALYEKDFDFDVPSGLLLVTQSEHIHAGSVLAYHKLSKTIHVDDTFGYNRDVPWFLRWAQSPDTVSLHPFCRRALEPRKDAGKDFKEWVLQYAESHKDCQNLCAAHTTYLMGEKNQGPSIYERLKMLAGKDLDSMVENHDKHYAQ